MRRIVLATLACLCSATAFAQAPNTAGLDTFLNRLARHDKMMGYLQFSKGGRVLYAKGFGEARPGLPNTAQTVFRIGSISKTFTATMIMQLVDAHKIRREDKLGNWFPQIPNASRITIDQLLSHRSGIHSITDDTTFMRWQDTVTVPAGVLRRMAAQPADFEPGAKAEYSNSNYILLGYILEKLSGKSYASLLRERITAPLKLKSTGMGPKSLPAKSADAGSYSFSDGKWTADPLSGTGVPGGAGGIASTVPELAVFIDALMRGKLVSDTALAMMKEIRDGYGRGLIRFPFNDRYAYGHNGQIDNFSGNLAFFPKDSTVVSLVCNGVNYNINDLMVGVLRLYFGREYNIPDFAKAIALSRAQTARLEGTYSNAQVGMDIVVKAAGNAITAQASGQAPLFFDALSPERFENSGVGAQLEFSAEAAAAQTMTLTQGGGRLEFKRK